MNKQEHLNRIQQAENRVNHYMTVDKNRQKMLDWEDIRATHKFEYKRFLEDQGKPEPTKSFSCLNPINKERFS